MARILIVEDDAAQRFLIEMMLRRVHYDVACAANGDEALRILTVDSDFDAILSDLQMPGMDGGDFLGALAEHYPHLPVIVMTVHAGSEWADDALQHGAAACLPKPFFTPDLFNTLDAVLHGNRYLC
jgi:CheY-like chemotaxis protein